MMSYTPEAMINRADETVQCGEIIGLEEDADAFACLTWGHAEFPKDMDDVEWLECAELFAIVIHGKEVLDRAQCIDRFGHEVIDDIEQPATFRLQSW